MRQNYYRRDTFFYVVNFLKILLIIIIVIIIIDFIILFYFLLFTVFRVLKVFTLLCDRLRYICVCNQRVTSEE